MTQPSPKTVQFVEDAIAGGWKPERHRQVFALNPSNQSGVHTTVRASYTHVEILLSPESWKAVGKVRGWGMCTMYSYVTGKQYREAVYLFNMHAFIDALCEGLSIEEAISRVD